MLRATAEAVTVLDEALRAAEPDGIALMCDPAGQLPGHRALKPRSHPAARTLR
jgi:hypothetical protein